MNTIAKYVSIAVVGAAVAVPAYAMGRHDEKPHGVAKPPQQQQPQQRRQATGGRHDEGVTTHGMPAGSAKAVRPPAAESAAAAR